MFGLLPAFLGGAVGGLPTAPRRRGLQADMSRMGMHVRRIGPVVYIPGTLVTYAADTFDRADGALGTSSGGQTWAVETSSSFFLPAVASNRCVRNASGASMGSVDVGHTAYTATLLVKPNGSSNPGDGITFKGNDGTNCFRFVFTGTDCHLFKVIGGTQTLLGDGSMSIPNDGSVEYLMSVTVDASSNITCKVDGVTKVTATDAALSTGTQVGVMVSSASSSCNDLLVTS